MNHDHEPLTPEERALADRLARSAPRHGPSAALDAAILASARQAAATAAAPAPLRRRQRRWPAVLGVAASLALAVGIAWQLRPAPEQAPPVFVEGELHPFAAPAPEVAAAAAASEGQAAVEDAPDAATAPPPQMRELAPPPEPAPPSAARPAPAAAPARHAPTPPAPVPGMDAERAVRDAARGAGASATAVRPPPPAPPAPPAPVAAPAAAPDKPASSLRFASPPPTPETALGHEPVRRTTAPQAEARRAAARASKRADSGRIQMHDLPPATLDSPQAQQAWLERIRELRDTGEIEAARDNLREYLRRHPGQPLPEDLDGLLDE